MERRRIPPLFVRIAGPLVAVILVAAGCSGGGGDTVLAGGDGPPTGDDVDPSEHVTLTDETVVIRGGADVVLGVSDDHSIYSLDADAEGVADLEPGRVLLIPGVDAGNVTAVEPDGEGVAVTLGPAYIRDVIQDGTITWDAAPPDDAQGIAFAGTPTFEASGGATTTTASTGTTEGAASRSTFGRGEVAGGPELGLALVADAGDSEAELKASIRGWELALQPKVEDGAVELALQASKSVGGVGESTEEAGHEGPEEGPDDDTGALELGVNITVHADGVAPEGSISISGGDVTNASMHTPMTGWVEVDASARTPEAGQYPASILIRVPIAYEWPVFIYGIPFYVSLQTNFLIQPSLSTEESGIETSARIEYSGEAGFRFADGEGGPDGDQVTVEEPQNPLDASTATPSPGALAMVFAAEAPRIGFGIGTMGFLGEAKMGVYIDLVSSFGFTVAPATAMLPCRSMNWSMAVNGGGEFEYSLGVTEVGAEKAVELVSAEHTWIAPEIKGCEP